MEQNQRTVVKKAPPALILLGLMLATLLAATATAMAQERQVITTPAAAGVLRGPVEDDSPDPTPVYEITDEESGTTYRLISGFLDLGAFVGQRILIYGAPVPGPGAPGSPDLLNVTDVFPLGASGETVAATFELTIDGEVPEGGSFGMGLDLDGESVASVVFCATNGNPNVPVCEDGATYSGTLEVPAESPVSFEYAVEYAGDSVTDRPYREVFYSEDNGIFPKDATVSATYAVPEGGTKNPGSGSNDNAAAGGRRIVGTDGPDDLRGTPGDDAAYGGYGDDFIDAADAAGAFDAVYCGPGNDLVLADAEDFVADDCEEVIRY